MEQLPAIDASCGGQLVHGNICDFLVYFTEIDQVMNVLHIVDRCICSNARFEPCRGVHES